MRAPIVVALVGALLIGAAVAAHAQVTPVPPVRDSTKPDSLHPKRDTISVTDYRLKVEKQQLIQHDPLPLVGVDGVRPFGGRIVFPRDSIDWVTAETVGELLANVPGVYLERGGWLGRAEIPDYEGLGAASVEYVVDGVPYHPIGLDSVAVDPSLFSLALLDRVEAEPGPGLLRVFLFTRRYDREAPRTKIGFSTGDRGLARYMGSFERRYPSGFGLGMAVDYFGVNAPTGGTGGSHVTNSWLQMSYVASPRFGIQAQVTQQAVTRDSLLDAVTGDTLSRTFDGTRTDAQLRLSLRDRDDGLGRHLDLFAANTSWSNDSLHRNLGSFGAVAAIRHPTWSAEFNGWHYTSWTPVDSRFDLGWTPTRALSGSVELIGQRHSGDRASAWGTAGLGVQLPDGFRVGGTLRGGQRVQDPSIAADPAQRFMDEEVFGALNRSRFSLQVGYSRIDGWQPTAYPEFVAIASLAPLPRTDWVTLHARVSPLGWLSLETVYEQPRNGVLPDGTPPQHALSTATIRSRFLRNFPSGIFELKAQAMVESWSPGIGGRDSTGEAIPLAGATFIRSVIQLKLGPFIAYFDRVNLRATRTGSVPGYPIAALGSTYGVRWEFSN